jgi:predicted phosphodiesterase
MAHHPDLPWLKAYAARYGEKIIRHKRSYRRVATSTGLSLERAAALCRFVRGGDLPSVALGAPNSTTKDLTQDHSTEAQEIPNHPSIGELSRLLEDYEEHSPDEIIRTAYRYDKSEDCYTVTLVGEPPLVMPGDIHRAIIKAYSSFNGIPTSVNKLARVLKWGRPRVRKYLRAFGMTHDGAPMTDEEIILSSTEDIVQDQLASLKAAKWDRVERARESEVRKAARLWWDAEARQEHLSSLLRIAMESIDPVPPVPAPEPATNTPYLGILAPSDFHWGLRTNAMETGADWDRKAARKTLLKCIDRLFNKWKQHGRPDKILLVLGSDWLHVDSWDGSTTKGTTQDVDGTYADIFITGLEMARDLVERCAWLAPVEVVVIPGNHDRQSSVALSAFLHAWFRTSEHIAPPDLYDQKSRWYTVYGETLIGLCHGDGIKPEKMGPLASVEARELMGRTKRTVFFHGHHHHFEAKDINGARCFKLPALVPPDRWHQLKGFTLAQRGLTGFRIDKASGEVDIFQVLYK